MRSHVCLHFTFTWLLHFFWLFGCTLVVGWLFTFCVLGLFTYSCLLGCWLVGWFAPSSLVGLGYTVGYLLVCWLLRLVAVRLLVVGCTRLFCTPLVAPTLFALGCGYVLLRGFVGCLGRSVRLGFAWFGCAFVGFPLVGWFWLFGWFSLVGCSVAVVVVGLVGFCYVVGWFLVIWLVILVTWLRFFAFARWLVCGFGWLVRLFGCWSQFTHFGLVLVLPQLLVHFFFFYVYVFGCCFWTFGCCGLRLFGCCTLLVIWLVTFTLFGLVYVALLHFHFCVCGCWFCWLHARWFTLVVARLLVAFKIG